MKGRTRSRLARMVICLYGLRRRSGTDSEGEEELFGEVVRYVPSSGPSPNPALPGSVRSIVVVRFTVAVQ